TVARSRPDERRARCAVRPLLVGRSAAPVAATIGLHIGLDHGEHGGPANAPAARPDHRGRGPRPTVAGGAAHCPYPWMDVIARRAVTSAGEARPRAHARSARSST